MKRVYLFFLFIVFCFTAVACSSASNQGNRSGETATSKGDAPVKYYKIVLQGNPTTGYIWHYRGTEGTGKVRLMKADYEQYKSEEGMVGVGGDFTFIYKPIKPGKVTLVYDNIRPWDGGGTAETKKFTYTITDDLEMIE